MKVVIGNGVRTKVCIATRAITVLFHHAFGADKQCFVTGRAVLALALIVTLSACSVCDIKEGRYRSIGGSEKAVDLNLMPNRQFNLSVIRWRPDNYEDHTKSVMQGSWSCKNRQVLFAVEDETFAGTLTPIGENPLGLDSSIEAILLDSTSREEAMGLEGEILYPANAVSESE